MDKRETIANMLLAVSHMQQARRLLEDTDCMDFFAMRLGELQALVEEEMYIYDKEVD